MIFSSFGQRTKLKGVKKKKKAWESCGENGNAVLKVNKKVWGNEVDEKRGAAWNGIGWKRRPCQRRPGWFGKPL